MVDDEVTYSCAVQLEEELDGAVLEGVALGIGEICGDDLLRGGFLLGAVVGGVFQGEELVHVGDGRSAE